MDRLQCLLRRFVRTRLPDIYKNSNSEIDLLIRRRKLKKFCLTSDMHNVCFVNLMQKSKENNLSVTYRNDSLKYCVEQNVFKIERPFI